MQMFETTTCASGASGCPSGTFGYGGNTTASCAGGAGGGWFGGSASSSEKGGGGGSGYVFTASSFKPEEFLLTPEFYLKNTMMLNSVGPRGNGSAVITKIVNVLSVQTFLRQRQKVNQFLISAYLFVIVS